MDVICENNHWIGIVCIFVYVALKEIRFLIKYFSTVAFD